MGGATEKDWLKRPSDRQLQEAQKKTERTVTPVVEAVCVPAHLALPGPCKPNGYTTFTLNSHWGRAATGKNVLHLCMQGRLFHDRLFGTL